MNRVKILKRDACPKCGHGIAMFLSETITGDEKDGRMSVEVCCTDPDCDYNPILDINLYDLLRESKALSKPAPKHDSISKVGALGIIIDWGYETSGDFDEACRVAHEIGDLKLSHFSQKDMEWIEEEFNKEYVDRMR